jgi:hypothetical protein
MSSRILIIIAFVATLAGVAPRQSFAEAPARAEVTEPAHRVAPPRKSVDADAERYQARDKAAAEQKNFQGGQVFIVVSAGALIVGALLVLLLM